MKVFQLAKRVDATVSDIQLEGRLMGLLHLRPNSDLADYQADAIAKRLIDRMEARRPAAVPIAHQARVAADFRGLSPLEQQIMEILERPHHDEEEGDLSRIDLKLIREGLGMSLELGAATIGVDAADLRKWEGGMVPSWKTRELLAGYSIHMAAMWGFDDLRLGALNFEEMDRGSDQRRITTPRPNQRERSPRPAKTSH